MTAKLEMQWLILVATATTDEGKAQVARVVKHASAAFRAGSAGYFQTCLETWNTTLTD